MHHDGQHLRIDSRPARRRRRAAATRTPAATTASATPGPASSALPAATAGPSRLQRLQVGVPRVVHRLAECQSRPLPLVHERQLPDLGGRHRAHRRPRWPASAPPAAVPSEGGKRPPAVSIGGGGGSQGLERSRSTCSPNTGSWAVGFRYTMSGWPPGRPRRQGATLTNITAVHWLVFTSRGCAPHSPTDETTLLPPKACRVFWRARLPCACALCPRVRRPGDRDGRRAGDGHGRRLRGRGRRQQRHLVESGGARRRPLPRRRRRLVAYRISPWRRARTARSAPAAVSLSHTATWRELLPLPYHGHTVSRAYSNASPRAEKMDGSESSSRCGWTTLA